MARGEGQKRKLVKTSGGGSRREDHRRWKGSVVGGHPGECGARGYNGGLGAEPPVGSRGRAPGRGEGAKPPEAESI